MCALCGHYITSTECLWVSSHVYKGRTMNGKLIENYRKTRRQLHMITIGPRHGQDSQTVTRKGISTCYEIIWGQPFTQNKEQSYWKMLSSCTTMPDQFSTIQHAVRNLHLRISNNWTAKGGCRRSSVYRWWRGEGSDAWLASPWAKTTFLTA
jgi:hypothetical protein